ncbi:YgaP family membrane protein [Peribacillus glennii]|uniref:DUF2892 domain-containing protein n=1 Tax=Peribacillus glennii TaxID=2303991 RepID=A0A372L8V2_9BACI|nr:DUF2892 domain-containing protein [Peribacillus glennii]RFU61835.1 DUF2892 domain-containing protein [Peribacillus glennii]
MKGQQNIGVINALIRMTFGFTIVAWATAKLVKKPWRDSYILLAMIGAMKIGEGILRYCPLTAVYQKSQQQSGDQGSGNNESRNDNENSNENENENKNKSQQSSQIPNHREERRARQQY